MIILKSKFYLIVLVAFIILVADYHSKKIMEIKLTIDSIGERSVIEQDLRKLQSLKIDKTEHRLAVLEQNMKNGYNFDEKLINLNVVSPDNSFLLGFSCRGNDISLRMKDNKTPEEDRFVNSLPAMMVHDLAEDKEVCSFKFKNNWTCFNFNHLQSMVAQDSTGTIAFWFKKNSTGTIFSISDTVNDRAFRIYQDMDQLGADFDGHYLSDSWVSEVSLKKNSDDQWIQFALTQDGSGIKVYINGKEFQSLKFSKSENLAAWFKDYPNLDNGRLGCLNVHGRGDVSFYDGVIADFRYYRKALLPSEVSEIYNQGISHE